ncbi:MAG: T9SS type A sorting domain-containing protein, partial [Planctomycetes bacterium]|nr:T9SS type A sorting domain-containing protein [Planctomycetota bacterium]
SIPTQIGDLTNLIDLDLHSNQLSGNIPTTLQNCPLTQHLHLGYNMLTASDAALLAFLAVHDANWYVTQTVPPDGVGAAAAAGASVDVSWTPINYTGHGGYYQVRYGQNPGGPYPNDGGTTADKTAAGHTVSGLAPNTAYYFVVETYTPPHGDQQSALTSDPSAEATATTPSTVTQDIPIPVGWSWISSYATPPDPVMHNIWNPHWQAGNILFAQSYADGFWFRDAAGVVTNTFSASWDMEQMYRLYSSTSFDLSFTGAMAANPIPLTTGWNWTAYLLDTTMPAQNALASIITPGFLNIVQGLVGFCIPGIYCNLDMAPGQGYQFHMNTAANLDYNAHTTVREEASPPLAEEMLVHFGYTTTSQYYPLVFSDQNNDLPFTVGDEIGLFAQNGDDLFCIGAAVWTGEQPFAMRGWADDALTDARDGYTAGEPIILKYWSAVEDQEYALTVAFEDDASSYESALYSIADLATLSIEEPEVADHGFGLEQNHPNPWFLSSSKGNSSTSIRYQVPTAGQMTLSIHNAVGQLVRTLVDADMQPGRYQTEWDGRNDGQAKVAAGIYFYSLESGGQSLTRKMILLR